MVDILGEIVNTAPYIVEQDLESLAKKLLVHYSRKINSLSLRAYGKTAYDTSGVACAAFRERAKTELISALNSFILKSKYWKDNRDLNSYLLTSLNRLANRIHWDDSIYIKKNYQPVCPGCKFIGNKEFLINENKLFRCNLCTKELERLPEEIIYIKNKIDKTDTEYNSIAIFESRIRIHSIFALHSKIGYKCLECKGFIPESANGIYGISCPYSDCGFFGKLDDLQKISHPVALRYQHTISVQEKSRNESLSNSLREKCTLENVLASNSISQDIQISIQEDIKHEFEIANLVINEQIQSVKLMNSSKTMMQKLLMYEAYQNMLRDFPAEMISYLVYRKQISDFSVQSKIFQEYVRLIENVLPFDIVQGNDIYSITSLLDKNIKLFLGLSEYEAKVQFNYVIPNHTKESYTGGNKFKFYGPCFIGLLIDIIDLNTGLTIKNSVLDYTFNQINIKRKEIAIGTPVSVKHYRIASHYELGTMVILQRIRKRLVDSIYFRLHGERRVIGVSHAC